MCAGLWAQLSGGALTGIGKAAALIPHPGQSQTNKKQPWVSDNIEMMMAKPNNHLQRHK